MTYKINLGWRLWNVLDGKYAQVKLKTGGGSRELELPGETEYKSLLQTAKVLFFSNNGNLGFT